MQNGKLTVVAKTFGRRADLRKVANGPAPDKVSAKEKRRLDECRGPSRVEDNRGLHEREGGEGRDSLVAGSPGQRHDRSKGLG